MTNDVASQLLELLVQEKAHLVAGRIESITALEASKVDLLERLGQHAAPDEAMLRKLQLQVERNQELFEASRRGLKSAAARLSEIRRVLTQLDTYTSSGSLQTLQATAPKVERRA